MTEMKAPLKRQVSEMPFSPEHRLLLCCARLRLTATDRKLLRDLSSSPSLDWAEVIKETQRQCIVPLVYHHLHAACADLTPPDVLRQLRAEYLHAAARSMALAAELREITQLLEIEGVGALPYKGPVLALQAYGDIALRSFTDLDLIVRPRDIKKAREILACRGYLPLENLTSSQERAVLKLEHNLPLISSAGDIVVELHWRIAPMAFSFPMPMEGLWERAVPVRLGGQVVSGISVDDLMILLPVHGTRHAWSAIEWVTGIAELMRQPNSVCWNRVIRDAEHLRVGRIVRLAVALANRLLDAPIPDTVARWIDQDTRIPSLVRWVAARLFVPADLSSATQQRAVFQFEMAVKDGIRERLRDGFRRVTYPTGKDWAATGLPDILFPLYYLVRPGRLLARYLRHAVWGKFGA